MKAILLLMFLTPVLTELVTGSTTLTGFLNPVGLIFLLLGYSLPVLVLREYIVRNGIGLAGIMALGVAFGIFNEGLGAKTMVLMQGLPIAQFDMYGRFADVNFPWALVIGLYHALAAVLLPILIVHARYPDLKEAPWLSKKLTIALFVALMIIACGSFLSPLRLLGTPGQLVILLGLMVICFVVSRILPGKRLVATVAAPPRFRTFFLGISAFVAWLILPAMAVNHTPLIVFFAACAAFVWFYAYMLKRRGLSEQTLRVFGYGFYTQSALLGLVIGLFVQSPERIIAGLVLVCLFFLAAFRISKKSLS